jgi:hypothetical protein
MRTCVGSNGIIECEFLPKNAPRTLNPVITNRTNPTLLTVSARTPGGGAGDGTVNPRADDCDGSACARGDVDAKFFVSSFGI